jgi:hypothetical protein
LLTRRLTEPPGTVHYQKANTTFVVLLLFSAKKNILNPALFEDRMTKKSGYMADLVETHKKDWKHW